MLVEPNAQQLVWLDGAFVPWPEATIHVSSHHYGVGVFEGARAYAGESGASVFRLDDHTARLFRSAHILKLQIPERYHRDYLNSIQVELVRRNALTNAYLRPFVFYGGFMGLSPRTRDLSVHVAIMALEWRDDGAFHDSSAKVRGLVLKTAATRHHASALVHAKANANYLNGILAFQEAQASGADDALLLDENGYVTETSGANLFVVQAGVISTPPRDSVLEGITRDTVFSLASNAGFPIIERRMRRDEVYVADEAFLTGTAAEVTPIRELDGRRIGTGSRGPITERLQAMYAAHVRGLGDHRPEWLANI